MWRHFRKQNQFEQFIYFPHRSGRCVFCDELRQVRINGVKETVIIHHHNHQRHRHHQHHQHHQRHR